MIPDGVEVLYVPAREIAPRFGLAEYSESTGRARIRIREDLPASVRAFLLAHELCHVRDMSRGTFRPDQWIKNEIDANLHAARSHPLGLLLTLVWSLRPARLRYYWDRYISGGRYA